MAGVTESSLKKALPNGRAWNLIQDASLVLEGLGVILDRPRMFLKSVTDEARPESSTLMIDEWLALLGIIADVDATLGQKRAVAASALSAIGGQSLDYLNGRIQAVFPDVYLVEGVSADFDYFVRGFYPFSRDFVRLSSLLERLAPLHLQPTFESRPVFDSDVARCYIGAVGKAICGRSETAYSETEGQIARASIGVTGEAVTGRTIAI